MSEATIGFLLAVVLTVSSSPLFAADQNGQYGVRAIEKVKHCAGLNRAVAKAGTDDSWGDLYGFSLYTMGYLTAISRVASNTYDIAGSKNNKTVMVWLKKYCAKHPTDSFSNALYKMTSELYPTRAVEVPSKIEIEY